MNTLLTSLPKSTPLPRYATRLLGAALSATAYAVCLPWDLRNRAETAGAINETSPVTALGVTFLSLSLLSLAAYFGIRDRLSWTLLVVAAPPATLLYASLSSHPTQDANAWPVAWAFFTLVLGAGVLVAGSVARQFGPRAR
ncbi:hypothetical protein [Streptomyces kanamyceticus]|uniref:Integral membrane protein n=1 Tax=Streptomyces kanamyceticus TaxID=1967 RepID=A0A5J6GI22_STRKN|nr:hypothetical protein [Streptomyces kanamyceticus]QEU94134.1 hypothetical protein CP970_27405 [Streptomyces kanamyceticus]